MKKTDIYILILIAVVGAACFANTFPNQFVWDDRPLIVQDYHLRSLRYLPDIFSRDFFANSEDQVKYGYFRPLVTISYMGDLFLWGMRPPGFHLTNLLFHIGVCWLVYLLGRRLFIPARFPSAAAALLFAVHPVHTESVSWIAGRTDVISTFFFLLSFLLYLKASEKGAIPVRIVSLLSFLLALLAKEMAIVLPLIVLLSESVLGRRKPLAAFRRSLPYWGVVLLYLGLRYGLARVGSAPPGEESLLSIGLTCGKSFWLYLGKLIWPLKLGAYIRNPYLTSFLSPPPAAALMGAAFLILLLVKFRRDGPVMLFVMVSFLICFLPLSNFIRISAPHDMGFPVAERFLYLPSVFFVLLIGGLLPREGSLPRGLMAAGVFVLFFWSILTVSRNRDWREEGVFFRDLIRKNPASSYLSAVLGEHLIRAGDPAAGTAALKKAIDLERKEGAENQARLLNNLAAACRIQGRYEEAARHLEEARKAGGSGSALEYNAGMIDLKRGRLAAAEEFFNRALKLNPYSADTWLAKGDLCRQAGKTQAAITCFRQAVSLYPDSAELHNRLGVAAREAGDFQLSLREYDQALRLDPDHLSARVNRGVLFALLNRLDSAQADLEAVVAEKPDLWDAQNALGMVYARQGNKNLAYYKFKEIINNNPQNPDAHLNLGILHYQEGKISEARREFQTVLELKPEQPRARAFLKLLISAEQK